LRLCTGAYKLQNYGTRSSERSLLNWDMNSQRQTLVLLEKY
jgi:hypothetical protein